MAELNLKDLPDDLHRRLKMRAFNEGKTLRAFVIELLTKAINKTK